MPYFLKVQYGKITVWWMEPAAERNKKKYQVPIPMEHIKNFSLKQYYFDYIGTYMKTI